MRGPGSLRARLLLSHLAVTLVAVGLVAAFAGKTLAEARLAEIEHALEDAGFVISNELEEPVKNLLVINEEDVGDPEEAVRARLAMFMRGPDQAQLVIVAADGRAIAASGPATESGDDLRRLPEVAAAFRGGDVESIRRDTTGREMFYAAVPIEHEGQIYGVLQLATPMAPVRAQIAHTLAGLVGVVLGVMALIGAVAWWLADSVSRPVARLTVAAGRVAEGRLDERVPPGGPEELRQLATAFNYMAEKISRLIDEQRAFVANASHELRTPLTSVRLRAEALRAGAWQDPEAGPKFLAEIESEVDRLGKMVNDLLDLSRIESGLDMTPAPVDLVQLAREAREAFSVRAERAGVTLTVEVEGAPPPVAGDETQLRRVLDNLLDNAIKYTPAGGRVVCRVTGDARSVSRPPSPVTLSVSDTGPGIPSKDLPHIFDRFYRGDATRPRGGDRRSGSGLGLSIVQSIVRAHGGEVSAENVPGQGATIKVTFPPPLTPPARSRLRR